MIADIQAHFRNVSRLRCEVEKMTKDEGFSCEVTSEAYMLSPGVWTNDGVLIFIWRKGNKLGSADDGIAVSGISKVAV